MNSTIILTNTHGEILGTLDAKPAETKVGISPRPGQQLHAIEMPDAYHKHQTSQERGEWLKQYRIKNGTLVRHGG